MTKNINTGNIQSKAATLAIVTDPVDLYYGKNPIECEVNSFLRKITMDCVTADEIATISYLLNIIEIKGVGPGEIIEWDFLPENVKQVKNILEGITLEPICPIHSTDYDSVLSVLLALVGTVVAEFISGERY